MTAVTFTILQIRVYTQNHIYMWKITLADQTSNSLPTPQISWYNKQLSYRGKKGRRHHHSLSESVAELLEQEADNTRGVYFTQLTLSTLSKHPASTSIF